MKTNPPAPLCLIVFTHYPTQNRCAVLPGNAQSTLPPDNYPGDQMRIGKRTPGRNRSRSGRPCEKTDIPYARFRAQLGGNKTPPPE
ncbi:hypothetical protein F9K79_12125 [Ochrobactrum sp. Kaboul]|nr:hypothetical protein F9K79_12125 [Ochrobactrum sp. Kaboul]